MIIEKYYTDFFLDHFIDLNRILLEINQLERQLLEEIQEEKRR